MSHTYTHRLNIGYDGINSSNDIITDVRDYTQEIEEWFSEQSANCTITLHHEHSKEIGSVLYYLDVLMEHTLSENFQRFFL